MSRLANILNAIKPQTISASVSFIVYLLAVNNTDMVTFSACSSLVFLTLCNYNSVLTSAVIIVTLLALLERLDMITILSVTCFIYTVVFKSCNFYTFAIILSVVLRMLLVMIRQFSTIFVVGLTIWITA